MYDHEIKVGRVVTVKDYKQTRQIWPDTDGHVYCNANVLTLINHTAVLSLGREPVDLNLFVTPINNIEISHRFEDMTGQQYLVALKRLKKNINDNALIAWDSTVIGDKETFVNWGFHDGNQNSDIFPHGLPRRQEDHACPLDMDPGDGPSGCFWRCRAFSEQVNDQARLRRIAMARCDSLIELADARIRNNPPNLNDWCKVYYPTHSLDFANSVVNRTPENFDLPLLLHSHRKWIGLKYISEYNCVPSDRYLKDNYDNFLPLDGSTCALCDYYAPGRKTCSGNDNVCPLIKVRNGKRCDQSNEPFSMSPWGRMCNTEAPNPQPMIDLLEKAIIWLI